MLWFFIYWDTNEPWQVRMLFISEVPLKPTIHSASIPPAPCLPHWPAKVTQVRSRSPRGHMRSAHWGTSCFTLYTSLHNALPGTVSLKYHDAQANIPANGSAAFIWKLHCHWLKCLQHSHVTWLGLIVVIVEMIKWWGFCWSTHVWFYCRYDS